MCTWKGGSVLSLAGRALDFGLSWKRERFEIRCSSYGRLPCGTKKHKENKKELADTASALQELPICWRCAGHGE